MNNIVNIAGYRFVDLPDRDALQAPFQKICAELELKGTILLSTEGINFFLAAAQDKIDAFIEYLEKELMIPIKIVSVGPDRNETIHR